MANILGGKLDAVQGRITEGEIFFCEVSVHKEADSHAIHHAWGNAFSPFKKDVVEGIVELIFNSAIIESSQPTDTCSRRAPISSRCQPGLAEQSRSSSTPVSSRLLKTKQCYNTLLLASRFDLSLVSWWEKCWSPSVGGIIWKPCEICSARRRPTIFLSATKRKILVRSGARIPTSENPRSLSGRKVKLADSSKVQVSPRGLKIHFFIRKRQLAF